MALSDYEKEILEQMESQLREDDPELASTMSARTSRSSRARSSYDTSADSPRRSKLSPRNMILGAFFAVIGMCVVLGGVTLGYGIWSILLGVLGFCIMVAGILFALHTRPMDPASSKKSGTKPSSGRWTDFVANQNRRWDERGRD